MQLPLMLVSLLGAAGLGLPDLPAMPDLIEIAENSVQGNFSAHTVEEPKIWLPTIANIKAMSFEERTARFHWFLFVFVLVFFSAVVAGTLVMVVGGKAKALYNTYHALGQTAPLSKEAQIMLVTGSLVVTISLSFAASIWSLQTGRLSKKVGLDWEVYLFLFCCGCFSLLIQSVMAVAWLKAGDRFDAAAFAVASMSVLPFVSDQFDTLKDIIFGALCVQSEHRAMKVLGILSWVYLLAFHAWFVLCGVAVGLWGGKLEGVPGANCFSELATSHLAVLLTAPKVDGESPVGFWEGTVLPVLYKQLTPSKRQFLLIENLPQAVLSLLFLWFEGGSMFVVVLNLAIPAVQVGLAVLLFKPVRAAAAPALGKALSRAVHTGNLIAAKIIWVEAEVGRDLSLFKQMMPRLRFLLDVMERSGFKELDKLNEDEIKVWQGIAEMLVLGEVGCDLNHRKIGDSGAKVVAEAMKHTAVKSLALEGNDIGDEGAEALGEGIKVNQSLQSLSLNRNSIGAAGAQALGEGIKVNQSLQSLSLNDNSIGAAGAQALGEGIKQNNSLVELGLKSNSIGDTGAQALSEGLKTNKSLQRLWLHNNSICDAGAQALGEGLKTNNTLKELYLDHNSIGDAGAQALAAAVIENRSLTLLRTDQSLRETPCGKALLKAEEKVKKERGEHHFKIEWSWWLD